MYCKCYYEFLISQRSRYNNKGFSKEVEIIDIWSQVSPRTLLVPRAVTPFSNRDVLSGHVYQRKQLSKIKFAPAAPPKQMHIVLQNLDLFKNWILKRILKQMHIVQKSLHVVIWLSHLKPR